jgi:hypothetical protein
LALRSSRTAVRWASWGRVAVDDMDGSLKGKG